MLFRAGDKHEIERGDVFLMTRDCGEDRLFLVERANEFVSSTFQCASAKGYQGEISSQVSERLSPDDPWYLPTYSLGYVISRWYMNRQVERGQATRLAHFNDLETARDSIRAWAERETDSLEVSVPLRDAELGLAVA